MTDSEESVPIPISVLPPRLENEGQIDDDNDTDISENIELRLKPQHPTFSFDQEEISNEQNNEDGNLNNHSGHELFTEKTLKIEEIKREEKRQQKINENNEGNLKKNNPNLIKEEVGVDGKIFDISKENNNNNSNNSNNNSLPKKVKPQLVSSINAKDILINVDKIKSLNEINGSISMSILLLLVNEMIWLTDMLNNGSITNRDITEAIFGDQVFTSILDHFNENFNNDNNDNNEDNNDNNEVNDNNNNNDIQTNNNTDIHIREEENNESLKEICINNILDNILNKKLRSIDKKRLELISKSQEELGISFRKSSKILSNFEIDVKPKLNLNDLKDFINENIGEYEKCSFDQDKLTWISNKFYLKSAPKMELNSYIDRINSHLEISGAVGLCAGWYLFKFLFNLKCNEKLSDGLTNFQILNNEDSIQWESRCLPLVLGNSFICNNNLNSNESDGDIDMVNNSGSNSNNNNNYETSTTNQDFTNNFTNIQNQEISSQPMDTSMSTIFKLPPFTLNLFLIISLIIVSQTPFVMDSLVCKI
ncbi:hypothetical protein C6P40_005238 [Pichia californica]|uniref:Uncharacterized protein n=1 Tax=Pichia californica TaxID=460514 RepID=A0A9P6WLH3_9ASCO|nr:hypothetical protein C6P40_005238 [[Candida] californica]